MTGDRLGGRRDRARRLANQKTTATAQESASPSGMLRMRPAGTHRVALDVRRLAPGVNTARLTAGDVRLVRRLTVAR